MCATVLPIGLARLGLSESVVGILRAITCACAEPNNLASGGDVTFNIKRDKDSESGDMTQPNKVARENEL